MSIAPPTDIVLDVAQAADPQRLQAARAKLAQIAGGGAADFADALGSAARPAAAKPVSIAVPDDRPSRVTTAPPSPYQRFEAMVMQSFIETMLPKDSELFGGEAAAGPYRAMMAEQIANQVARTGRIGIAKAIAKAHHEVAAGAASADSHGLHRGLGQLGPAEPGESHA